MKDKETKERDEGGRKKTVRLRERERDIDHHLFAYRRGTRGEDHTESSKGIRKEREG